MRSPLPQLPGLKWHSHHILLPLAHTEHSLNHSLPHNPHNHGKHALLLLPWRLSLNLPALATPTTSTQSLQRSSFHTTTTTPSPALSNQTHNSITSTTTTAHHSPQRTGSRHTLHHRADVEYPTQAAAVSEELQKRWDAAHGFTDPGKLAAGVSADLWRGQSPGGTDSTAQRRVSAAAAEE